MWRADYMRAWIGRENRQRKSAARGWAFRSETRVPGEGVDCRRAWRGCRGNGGDCRRENEDGRG